MVSGNDFITVPEAAEVLGYTSQHTRLLLRQNRLKGMKVGRDWLVLRESVNEFNLRRSTIPLMPARRRGRPSSGLPFSAERIRNVLGS